VLLLGVFFYSANPMPTPQQGSALCTTVTDSFPASSEQRGYLQSGRSWNFGHNNTLNSATRTPNKAVMSKAANEKKKKRSEMDNQIK
jgi:hypothetical protein